MKTKTKITAFVCMAELILLFLMADVTNARSIYGSPSSIREKRRKLKIIIIATKNLKERIQNSNIYLINAFHFPLALIIIFPESRSCRGSLSSDSVSFDVTCRTFFQAYTVSCTLDGEPFQCENR